MSLITTLMWVSFSIYYAVTNKPPTIVSSEIAEPLQPKLDTEAIGQIESRLLLNDSQIPDNPTTGTAIAEQTPNPTTPIPTTEPPDQENFTQQSI